MLAGGLPRRHSSCLEGGALIPAADYNENWFEEERDVIGAFLSCLL